MADAELVLSGDPEILVTWAAGPALEAWAVSSGRSFPWRVWTDSYRLVVVEILLQRTRANVVADFVEAFFERYPGLADLAHADISELEEQLRPLGLYRRRAKVLVALAGAIEDGDELGPELSGIGQYVDRAIRVTLSGEAVAMVDSNFVRVINRVSTMTRVLPVPAPAITTTGPSPHSTMRRWSAVRSETAITR